MDVQLGTVHSASADDELVHARIADHHAGHIVRGVGAVEVAFGAAEAAGVFVDVEQQHQAAAKLVGDGGEAGGDVAEDCCARLGVGAATSVEPTVL